MAPLREEQYDLPKFPDELFKVWDDGASLGTWRRALTRAQATGRSNYADLAREELAKLEAQDVTPLRALAANAELVKRLTGMRWFVMLDAREQGATWDQIAEAVGLPDADAARAWYLAKIELQERYVGDLHDAPRARAVLDERGDA